MEFDQQLKMGLLNDLHYDGNAKALNRLYEDIAALNQGGADFLVVLGDLITATSPAHAERLLREVAALCASFRGTLHYMPGNHDLDHLSKAQFYRALNRHDHLAHFHFEAGGYAWLGLDGNFSPNSTEYDQGNFRWQESFIPNEQLEWLQHRLAETQLPTVILTHQRIDPAHEFSVQNHAQVREILQSSGHVQAVFQGHQHADDLQQIGGISYYTLSAHIDDAGPVLVWLDPHALRLMRDFHPEEAIATA